ncbi:uncharacterized protein HMPREF1541_09650 [Cyphellophora europaea CBS 101466]|uniref:SNF2 N-terminal domain-containing protein n=1 Tax=Cyphellophora europaea (strain CBS 101466) TaxID=1220924 RepID=W2SAU1_CYPE1|nr:uncharacterized protein HMPREF1541_09650 [Cyphellophora europaea CBS 101466]ETN45817.1 hypothetical protein HMPREF1541_09650 [Cyphellophora europaea CBS 101466]
MKELPLCDKEQEVPDNNNSKKAQERFQAMEDLVKAFRKTLATTAIERPPLPEATIKNFLFQTGQQVKVVHNTFPSLAKIKALSQGTMGVSVQSEASMIAPHDNDKYTAKDKCKAWNKIRYVSAEIAAQGVQAIRIPNSPYQPVVSQIFAAGWMDKIESKAVGSGILAFDAGIGKTLSCLLHHYNQYRKKLLAYNTRVATAGSKKEKLPIYKPSIMICPAVVVAVWFTEI